MKTKLYKACSIISIASAAFLFLFIGTLNAKPKSCSGYLITKSGKVLRSIDMGWSWVEIKNFGVAETNKGRISTKANNFFESNVSSDYTVSIFNILGVEVLRQTLPGSMLPVRASFDEEIKNLPSGLYFVRYQRNGHSYYEKLLNY